MKPASYPEAQAVKHLLDKAQHVVILQADNPDADSLGSALALEHILGDLGKQVTLYCGVDMPTYLHYLSGWDRVQKELPRRFDLSIIVDASADSLFEVLNASPEKMWLGSRPALIIDHHATPPTIPFRTQECIHEAVATAEVLYELARELEWPLNTEANRLITAAILSDSLGLTSEATSARSIQIIAELVEAGVSIAALDANRREFSRKSQAILAYKGQLIERIEYHADGRLATVTIPWAEIEQYSQAYNPSMLVIDEMRSVEGVDVAIAFKQYDSGRVTAKIRCNYGKAIAQALAEHFGGGGHPYASGFKIQNGRPFSEIKSECIDIATQLLNNLDKDAA